MNLTTTWVYEEFPGALLGDHRRDVRFRRMVAQLCARPAGKVSDVFTVPAERQAAYDFLEHRSVSAERVMAVAARATAKRAAAYDSVFVVLDGSSFTLTDTAESKDFGTVGNISSNARGLKMLNAVAVSPMGEMLGVLDQQYWVRTARVRRGYRPLEQRESFWWHRAWAGAGRTLSAWAPNTRMHVLGDREADASPLLLDLLHHRCEFTIRANGTRYVLLNGRYVYVRGALRRQRPLARISVRIPPKGGKPARDAKLAIRAAAVTLRLRDKHCHTIRHVPLTVVWAYEAHPPAGEERVDWLLYSNVAVYTAEDAVDAVNRYRFRWRIEDFHRLLKRGGGCVEDTQLRSRQAVIKWATLHAIVAARAERLRDRARMNPDEPATTELSSKEIQVLVALKTMEKRRTESVSAENLTLQQAVRWLADLGGFTATGRSKQPPGATVIGRGLERVLAATQLLGMLDGTKR